MLDITEAIEKYVKEKGLDIEEGESSHSTPTYVLAGDIQDYREATKSEYVSIYPHHQRKLLKAAGLWRNTVFKNEAGEFVYPPVTLFGIELRVVEE